ncbi:fimbrial protein [Morganella morganii]|uniref:fimbrial protein n=1 Tax=Morganella morganii TaxID=582 RepID=UPI0034E48640
MKIKLLAALAALGMSGNALAYFECKVINIPNFQPEVINAKASEAIQLRADAEPSTTTPIGRAIPVSGSSELRITCEGDKIHMRRPYIGIYVPYPGFDNMYKTQIDGIGVKFITARGTSDDGLPLPRPEAIIRETPGASLIHMTMPTERFIAYFYKLESNVKLNTRYPDSNLLAQGGSIGQAYIENLLIANYTMESVYIVGIPVCTVDNPLPVNFDTINADDVQRGVEKPLEFGINCKTDYGNYDVTASIRSDNITSDGNYLKVTDSNNKDDSLVIKITDENNNHIKVDNSTEIKINNIYSGQKASFKWHAKLTKPNGQPYPAQGPFRANAIITLNIK